MLPLLLLLLRRHLKELSIRDNFSLDVSSLLDVLPSCKVRLCVSELCQHRLLWSIQVLIECVRISHAV